MKNYRIRFIICIFVAFLLTTITFACTNGTDFVGKWINIDNPGDVMEITRNGSQFLIISSSGKKIAATYKDGVFDAGYFKLTYVNDSDTLLGNSAVTGPFEFKKIH